MSCEILKFSEDQQMVYGWASVSTLKGEVLTDHHGDQIAPDEIEKASTKYMIESRVAKKMHRGDKIGEVVHSMPITEDIAKSLGIATDREGWIVGMKVYDDEVWAKVKSGELKAFSIGCRAIRKEV